MVPIYFQRVSHSKKPQPIPGDFQPCVILTFDRWNDFGFQTTFEAYYLQKGSFHSIGAVKIGTENNVSTVDLIDTANSVFESTYIFQLSGRYLSLGDGLSYYHNVRSQIPAIEDSNIILAALHDVVFLEHKQPHSPDLDLRSAQVFARSLLRNAEALTAYGSAKEILFPDELHPDRFNFALLTSLPDSRSRIHVDFRFSPNEPLPEKISVLIGKNGLGKTQILYAVKRALAGQQRSGELIYVDYADAEKYKPPFQKLIAIAFSPFEDFDTEALISSSPAYVYCGFRSSRERFDREYAYAQVGPLLASIIENDFRLRLLPEKAARPKLRSLIRALHEGLECSRVQILIRWKGAETPSLVDLANAIVDDPEALKETIIAQSISFNSIYIDDQPMRHLSAGQKMFVLSAVNVVAHIDRNSLLLMDEPELYLHPNLECAFMRMLKTILELFESFAIIATHSVFVAREVPARNVTILRRSKDLGTIASPAGIETFGADLSNIADYIFDNVLQRKPYEEWLDALIREPGVTFENLAERFAGKLNLESLIYLRSRIRRSTTNG